MLAVIPILSNSSLPLSNRAANFSTTLCLTLLAVLTRTSSSAAKPLILGGMLPVCFCVIMTLISAVQRNRDARRAWLLDLRHRRRMAEMGQEARHDPLTRLANRRRLEEAAAKLWSDEASHVSPISVILYDVDRFKAFNDLYGHQAGDECLQRVAACALEEIGADDDVAARYGGEEFILVLPRTPLEEARRVAERLRAAVAALGITHAGGAELGVVTASFGVACADSAARSFAQLTAEADAALYSAKRTGRNRVVTAGVVASKEPKAA
jgi:diguanylate cyclase (GGDEF)-like protein